MKKEVMAVLCCAFICITLIISVLFFGGRITAFGNTVSAGLARVSINNSSSSPSNATADSPFLSDRDAAIYLGMEYSAFKALIETGKLKECYTTYKYKTTEGVEVPMEDGGVRIEERQVTYVGYIFDKEKLEQWMLEKIKTSLSLD